MSNYRQDSANTEREPASQEERFVIELDSPNDIPTILLIEFAYQSDGKRAIVDSDIHVESNHGRSWDWWEDVKDAIERRLEIPCEFK